ncbi:MAG: chemotaxis protein CheC [Clostridia bacterium]|jgi:chemotaxis protein CheC|nr:chemotaxis protein CheC [Clostridia bacterium]
MAIENLEQLNEMHLDVLREIGNIGSGNAATSLSQMLNKKVNMLVPKVRILNVNDVINALGGPENPQVAILMKLNGDINGIMMFLIEQDFVASLLEALLGGKKVECTNLSELENSAISEIGNIMMSAYSNAIATLSSLNIRPSVPAVTIDMVGALLTVPVIEIGLVSDEIIFIENDFLGFQQETISANMLLVPDIDSLNKLMKSLGIG